jgi:phage regulator Rha-like protein
MPVLMPTPHELAHLSHHQRDRIRRAIWRIIAETDQAAARVMTDVQTATEYGERIRRHALMLEATTQRDDLDVILERRRVLLQAVAR